MRRAAIGCAVLSVALRLWIGGGAVAHAQPADEEPEADEAADEAAPKAQPVDVPAPPIEEDVMRYPPSSVRIGLIAGGLGLTLGAYGLSALMATTFDDVPGSTALYIPVAGPWISLAQNDCAPDDPDCGAILVLRGILLVIDGLAQAGGLGIAGEGLFMTTEAEEAPAADSALLVAPHVGPHSAGIAVGGRF